ncbi:MAG: N-acetyl-gamma-glutamyl-phosphate reductase [Anaerolineae bacterium]|nr:N-acetyl-gamma-glutamyl-phosphate reductase [Anaerolineae bacterium]
MHKINIGVFGAAGYSGQELVRLLAAHPGAALQFATSESQAGKNLNGILPMAPDITLQSSAQADLSRVDCVFLCLPHTQSANIAAKAAGAGVKVIDLSADLRIADPQEYQKWYGLLHPQPSLLPVVYGLPEFFRAHIRGAGIVANPGCFATAILLGMLPLVQNNLVASGTQVIIDAKSGTSGAGRKLQPHTQFGEVYGNLSPYNIGRAHRHLGEVEPLLAAHGFEPGRLIFSPHLLPTDRGILAALYIQVQDMQLALHAYQAAYREEALVELLPAGTLATLADVVRTPRAVISLTPVTDTTLIVITAIDNLLKGASSQAVQNFNLVYGFPETMGLLYGSGEPR